MFDAFLPLSPLPSSLTESFHLLRTNSICDDHGINPDANNSKTRMGIDCPSLSHHLFSPSVGKFVSNNPSQGFLPRMVVNDVKIKIWVLIYMPRSTFRLSKNNPFIFFFAEKFNVEKNSNIILFIFLIFKHKYYFIYTFKRFLLLVFRAANIFYVSICRGFSFRFFK